MKTSVTRIIPKITILAGALGTFYAGFNIVRYFLLKEIPPLWLGKTPMAFTTASVLCIDGLAIFWVGIWMRHHHHSFCRIIAVKEMRNGVLPNHNLYKDEENNAPDDDDGTAPSSELTYLALVIVSGLILIFVTLAWLV